MAASKTPAASEGMLSEVPALPFFSFSFSWTSFRKRAFVWSPSLPNAAVLEVVFGAFEHCMEPSLSASESALPSSSKLRTLFLAGMANSKRNQHRSS
eukprot:gnl/MRDRNA2_/MRDRNA2_346583_c0_seq1.p1 gnl/MRDRNA2_/MRDRNA2_346583_c0~~gnl/MRDRNA2_/MRDRNA2_346583_c0_seq1.p1  ORF type:complete len:108 (+),score=12.54 gnl/MRDRNA2_/MRDRNA2_346583_c0_seq1:35-325(+)